MNRTSGQVDYPVAFGHWSVRDDTLVCRLPRKTLTVTAPGELLGAVFELCDGRLAWREVAAELKRRWEGDAVQQFLSHLSGEGALVEAGEALAHWSQIGQVPGAFPRAASNEELPRLAQVARSRLLGGRGQQGEGTPPSHALAELLRARESSRTFADVPLRAGVLPVLAWAVHGVTRAAADPAVGWHRTIASGGNMHSARWFVFVLRELPDAPPAAHLRPGLYEARFHLDGGVSLEHVHAHWEDAWRLLVDPRVLQFASVLLLPVCDVGVPARKYGNRAALFAHIEVGQSLQNAQLMAAALGAAAMVRGDTAADAVLEALRPRLATKADPRSRWLAMPSLVLGTPPDGADVAAQKLDYAFQVTRGVEAAQDARPAQRCFAFVAQAAGNSRVFGAGRDLDPLLAMRKALAEGWERLGWATPGPCQSGKLADITGALDPRFLVAYSDRQHADAGFPVKPFSPRRKYLWRAGTDVASGRIVRLPAECIHALSSLPVAARRVACTNSSTSGVAAWSDEQGALCRATLELLERDAFVRAWLARRCAPLVATASLPGDARARVRALEAAGHRVAVARIGNGWVPVYSVFVQHDSRPYTGITAAADFDAERALGKALDEAEGRAAHAAAFPAQAIAGARHVQSTSDINRFYQTRRFFRRADFYVAGHARSTFARSTAAACKDWPSLQATILGEGRSLLAFDLTPEGAALDQGRAPLHVVRAFVSGLIPIWFHFGMQPEGLDAFREAVQHAQRGNPSFIHPFT